MNTRQRGAYGEKLVVQNLQKSGMIIIDRNVHMRHGEIDIIAVEKNVLHIIEVKTRRNDAFGGAVEALTRSKFIKMRKSAALWLQQQNQQYSKMQYDFAAVTIEPQITIEWFWNIGMHDLR